MKRSTMQKKRSLDTSNIQSPFKGRIAFGWFYERVVAMSVCMLSAFGLKQRGSGNGLLK